VITDRIIILRKNLTLRFIGGAAANKTNYVALWGLGGVAAQTPQRKNLLR
jgi:hypothetical protein